VKLPDYLKETLKTLRAATSDAEIRACLERSDSWLLNQPDAGCALAGTIGSSDGDDLRDDDLSQVFESALNTARMAAEYGQAAGQVFLDALENRLTGLAQSEALTAAGCFSLSRAYVRAGLVPPEALELSESLLARSGEFLSGAELKDPDAGFTAVFDDLIEQADGELSAIHAALSEMLPAMPGEMRYAVVAETASRTGDVFDHLATAWLLDELPQMRLAAAAGLEARLVSGRFDPALAADLVMLRAWMPGDAAQSKVDALIRQAMKRGIADGPEPKPWKLHKVLASLPDGVGAQSIALAVQSGSRRGLAMLLIKQGHGVKDAYVVPCSSAGEQRRLLAGIEEETGAIKVTPEYVHVALAAALADGLAHGMPPAAGLVEIARICGFANLRPEAKTTDDLLQDIDPETRIRAKSPQARGRLINESEFWRDRFAIIESWFEESDALSKHLETAYNIRTFETALWKWLESRRDWWARIIARSAQVMVASGDECADAFVATAQALQAGRALRKTPIIRDIFEQTRNIWIGGGLQIDSEITTETMPEDAEIPAPPRAEKPGELRRLLQGAEISADWVEGYLAAIRLAPKMIAPGAWLENLLPYALEALSENKLQRFLDLLILRYNALGDQLCDPATMDAVLGSMSDLDLEDWADGFSDGYESFKSSWPAKTLSKNDRAMLRHISQLSRDPQSRSGSTALLAPWLAARIDLA
jgi:Uncharacterised protein family (UPF0149)